MAEHCKQVGDSRTRGVCSQYRRDVPPMPPFQPADQAVPLPRQIDNSPMIAAIQMSPIREIGDELRRSLPMSPATCCTSRSAAGGMDMLCRRRD